MASSSCACDPHAKVSCPWSNCRYIPARRTGLYSFLQRVLLLLLTFSSSRSLKILYASPSSCRKKSLSFSLGGPCRQSSTKVWPTSLLPCRRQHWPWQPTPSLIMRNSRARQNIVQQQNGSVASLSASCSSKKLPRDDARSTSVAVPETESN